MATSQTNQNLFLLAGLALALGGACAKADVDTSGSPGGSGPGQGGNGGGGFANFGGLNGGFSPLPCANDVCEDFPAAPIVEAGAEGVEGQFSGAGSDGGGPCIMEPEDGSLFPSNWLRPRIRWTGATGPVQLKFTAPKQKHELVVYTTASEWKMPKDMWRSLSSHARGGNVTVQVRVPGGGTSKARFGISNVEASGSMVFWAAKPAEVGKMPTDPTVENDSELRGFAVGDESTVVALRIPDIEQPSRTQGGEPRKPRCIGCHVATPDGQYVAFTDHWPWNSVIAGVKPDVRGKPLPSMSQGGLSALNRPWGGMMAFSNRHWTTGDRTMVVSSSLQNPMAPWATDNNKKAELVWYNLDSPAPMDPKFTVRGVQFGVIAREGDTRGAASPDWSKDGTRIAYASTNGGNLDGRLEKGATDLYTVPFNNRAGGPATPVPGASEADFEEYYPAWSPDDQLIAYNRVPAGQTMYANPNAELFAVSVRSGQSLRLAANDPPACSGKKSPGINNHWVRWSPSVQSSGSSTVYWIVFSSNRGDIPPVKSNHANPQMPGGSLVQVSQLYMSAVVVNENGVQTFPAIYLWNQPTDTLNTTPAWEAFQLPPVL